MSGLFLFIYDFFSKRKPLLYGFTIAIFVVSLLFSMRIRFEEDITRFIPDDGEMKATNAVFQNIRIKDRLVLHLRLTDTISAAQPDRLIAYCDSLAGQLSPLVPEYIHEIITQTSDDITDVIYDLLYDNLPVFLQEEDYIVIDSLLQPEAIEGRIRSNYNVLTGPGGFALRHFIAADPLSLNVLPLNRLKKMQPDSYDSYKQYFFTADHGHLLFFLVPANSATESSNNAQLIDYLDDAITRLQPVFPEVTAEYFGGPAVSVCNARQIKRDTMLTLNIALVVIIIFIILLFRSKRTPLLILLPVLFGAAVALMMLYFIKGTVSAITVGAGSVVVGIALNYSMHVMSHLKHAASPREVVSGLASPLTLGSATTIGAFLGLTFAKSQALADFGLFAAFCLMGSALFCLIVLPHLVKINTSGTDTDSKLFAFIERIASWQPEKNYILLAVMAVFTVVCLFFVGRTSFDSDMMKLNYMDEKLQQAERNLQAITTNAANHTVYIVSTGKNLQEAETNNLQNIDIIKQLQQEGLVTDYVAADILLIPEAAQQQRIARWNAFWTEGRREALRKDLYEAGARYEFSSRAMEPFLSLLDNDFQPVDITADEVLKTQILPAWLSQTDSLSMIMAQVMIPAGLKMQAYDRLDNIENLVVFDKSYFAGKFVHIISDDFYFILFISSFIVFFALWLSYGRIELALMTFAPMVLSWIWITGFMGAFGIGFNIVNIIISTFIFGLGDDYSIFITDGLSDGYRSGKKTLPAHKTAIFLSAFAMIVGTGVLIFARHPALKSIATVSTVGMLSVVLVAYTIQPFLYRFFISGRTAQGKYPFTLFSLLSSIYVFVYFGLGSILLSLLSLLLKIIPAPRKAKKYWLHWLMSKLAKSTLYCYPPLRKRFLNPHHEDFSRPAVIIANHQSFLDILCILAFHPRIVMLTNSWVWNSPFFGLLVRNAGFYHTGEGYEGSEAALRSIISDGYSIVVFPEGTRSADGHIRRFHNGAFFLAAQLGLDILPVVLHGNGLLMPKKDPFNIRRGWLTVEVLPRITHARLQQGGLRENAANACDMLRVHYADMEARYRVPGNPYFRQHLITAFLFKGPVLEWYLRIKLRMERNYQVFNTLISREATITDIGCGYGFLAYMLSFMSDKRKITGIDYDEEKITVANHCFIKNEQLQFIHADAAGSTLPQSDVFILSDMLHYLSPEKQQQLLHECARKLNPGGSIIIRDADRNQSRSHRLTRLTELFSTRILGFNKTTNELYFMSGKDIEYFASQNGFNVTKMQNDRHTSNMIYVVK